jgi:regulator of replication initiation timing
MKAKPPSVCIFQPGAKPQTQRRRLFSEVGKLERQIEEKSAKLEQLNRTIADLRSELSCLNIQSDTDNHRSMTQQPVVAQYPDGEVLSRKARAPIAISACIAE